LKQQFKYILSSLIVLSLIGLGENISINCPNVKYYKETEWVSESNPVSSDSNCFDYSEYFAGATTNSNIKLWTVEHILYYNNNVNVIFISQTNTLVEIKPFNILISRIHSPRKSIEYHSIS